MQCHEYDISDRFIYKYIKNNRYMWSIFKRKDKSDSDTSKKSADSNFNSEKNSYEKDGLVNNPSRGNPNTNDSNTNAKEEKIY